MAKGITRLQKYSSLKRLFVADRWICQVDKKKGNCENILRKGACALLQPFYIRHKPITSIKLIQKHAKTGEAW